MDQSDSLRCGLIGCGFIGTKRAVSLPTNVTLTKLYDIDIEKSRSISRLIPTAEIASSVNEIFEANDLDFVIIATTHQYLAEYSFQAVQAGKHVLVEKPGATDTAAMSAIEKLAGERGLKVSVGFNHRFHPSILKAKRLAEENSYGRLMWIRGRYGHGGRVGYESEWRAERAISGGGELIDQGSHLLDLSRVFAGNLELKFADISTQFWNMNVEDNAFLALRFDALGVAWLHASWTEWKNTFSFELSYEFAKMEITGLGGSYGTERLALYEMTQEMGPPNTSIWEFPQADRSWKLENEDFVGSLSGEVSRGATLSDAIKNMEIISKAYRT